MGTTDIAAAAPAGQEQPCAACLAEGVELIGEFEDSGFKEPPLLARRADGQVVQLTRLLYLVAQACDGRRDADAIAQEVTERFGRKVSADNITFLVEEKLRPLGVLAGADGSTPKLQKREALLALRHRKALLSEPAVNKAAGALTWLHTPVVTAAVVLGLVAFDVWLFGIHGLAGGLRSALYAPGLLLVVLASVVVATAFHELGHASACRHGGARPGVMGVGVYLVWPAFYCDVTDAYRLNRKGRLRTDVGGVYFNAIFALLAGGVYFATGEEAALLAAFLQHMIILQQLIPLLRFDGYYVLSDLTGVPDILSRIKPILRSIVRPRASEPQVAELKPWVRVVVSGYVIALVPALALLFGSLIMGTPRMVATTYDSLGLQLDRLRDAGGPDEMALGGFHMLAIVMPVAAMSLSLGRTGKRAAGGVYRWASGGAPRAAMAAAGTLAVIGAAAYVWWPNGDYEPIRPGERGTIGEVVKSIPAAAGGRPAFTPEREARFAPVPTVREQRSPTADGPSERRSRNGVATPESRQDEKAPAGRDDDETPGAGGGEGTGTGEPQSGSGETTAPDAGATPTPGPAPGDSGAPAPTSTPAPAATPAPTATATPEATPAADSGAAAE